MNSQGIIGLEEDREKKNQNEPNTNEYMQKFFWKLMRFYIKSNCMAANVMDNTRVKH